MIRIQNSKFLFGNMMTRGHRVTVTSASSQGKKETMMKEDYGEEKSGMWRGYKRI